MIPIHRVMSMLIVSSVMIGIVPSQPVQSTAPSVHSTTNQATANDILLDSDDYQVLTSGQPSNSATILPKTDQDIFYIDAEAQQEIRVEMQRSADEVLLNGELSLFDPEERLIASDDNSGAAGNPLIASTYTTTTGRYAIWVRDHAGTRTGSYRLTATVTDPLVPAAEYSSFDLELDPCPEPAETLDLPALESIPNQPQNATVKHTNQALPRTNYPLNCEFARDREILAMLNPESFSIVNANQTFTTEPVVVPEASQMLRFEYLVGRKTADSLTPLTIEVLSGANFATITNLSNGRIKGQYRLGWQTGLLNIQAFRGQTIKLRFINDWQSTDQPSAQVRNLALIQEIPDWELSTVGEFAIRSDNLIGAYAVITGANASLTSSPILITQQAQSLSFRYRTGRWLNDKASPLYVEVFSGTTFASVTRIDQGTLSGRLTDGWHEAVLDIQAFRGQTIKIKIVNDWWPSEPQVTSIDSFKLNWAVPGWDISNASFVHTDYLNIPASSQATLLNPDFEQTFIALDGIANPGFDQSNVVLAEPDQPTLTLSGAKSQATSIAIAVPLAATSIHFDYLVGDQDNATIKRTLQVALLSGDSFEIREFPRGAEFQSSTQAGWQHGLLDLSNYRGRTIKLQFTNTIIGKPTSQIKQLNLIQDIPGWQASNHQLASIGSNAQSGNYVSIQGSSTQLTSLALTVPLTAQQVRFNYQAGLVGDDNARRQVTIALLSGEKFEIATIQPELQSSTNLGWRQGLIDVQRFQGQTIKLQFRLSPYALAYLRVDDFQLGQVLAGWSASEQSPLQLDSIGNHGKAVRLGGNNASLTSDAWTVLSNTQALQFNYKAQLTDPNARSSIMVNVLSGDAFAVITPIDAGLVTGTGASGWQQASLDLSRFQDQTIKLQFKSQKNADAVAWFDNLQIIAGSTQAKQAIQHAPDNAFIEIAGNNQSITSSSFVVASTSQYVRFLYQVGNQDQGNVQQHLAVEILSGLDFTTITRIDQQQLRYALNDGWKVAQLPISAFQNQAIKIRFIAPDYVSAPIVRIDKVALLTPRATLTSPITATGTTYLNVPRTELAGMTTTATMTITSLVVYDEYMNLAGEVRYDDTKYPFSMTGDLYKSSLGTPGDVVADLQDTTKTFDSLYFAVRQQPFGPQTNPSITNNNLSFYLQREGTREATLIDLGLNNPLDTMINPIFQLTTLRQAEYGSDYWFGKLLEPESTFEAMGDPNEKKWTWKRRTIGEDCSLLQRLDFGVVVSNPDSNIRENSGEFGTQLEVLGSISDGYVTPGKSWPSNSCDIYDADNAGVTLGAKDDPVTVKYVSSGNGLNGNAAEGDYLSNAIFGGKAAVFKNDELWFDQFMGDLIQSVDLVSKIFSMPITIGDVTPLFPENTPYMSEKPSLLNSMVLTDWDDNPNTKIKVLRIPFSSSVLLNSGNYFTTFVDISCKKQNINRDMKLKIYWDIPLYDDVTKKELNTNLYNKTFLIDYKSGPCNK